ncbi:hypothetical protein [Streptomyces sp. NPDC056296]|uniref:hypothetical protein n=1 Tax=Streptomyces sp. NPDC056296 TaxID=3345775 RepID=UPI0035E0FFF6
MQRATLRRFLLTSNRSGFGGGDDASLLVGGLLAILSPSTAVAAPVYGTSEAGNPFVDGWYADPDIEIGTYRGGANGVRVFEAAASFDNVAVVPAR